MVMSSTMGSWKRIRIGRETFLVINSLKSTSISSCLAWMPQFLVARRNSWALFTRIIGGYVSGRKTMRRPKAEKPMMAEMYSVHLQPR